MSNSTNPRDLRIVDVTEPFAGSGDPSTEGIVHLTLSDGSVYRSGGFADYNEEGGVVTRAVMTPLDAPTTDVDGPIIDDAARALYEKLGIEVPAAKPPLVLHTEPTAPAQEPATTTEPEPPVANDAPPAAETSAAAAAEATSPAPTPAAPIEAHIRHAQLLHDLAFKIERGVQIFVHDIVDAIHRVV